MYNQGCRNKGAAGPLAPPALVEGGKSALFIEWYFGKKSIKYTPLPSKYHYTFEFGKGYHTLFI